MALKVTSPRSNGIFPPSMTVTVQGRAMNAMILSDFVTDPPAGAGNAWIKPGTRYRSLVRVLRSVVQQVG